jgi:hypothetical protein
VSVQKDDVAPAEAEVDSSIPSAAKLRSERSELDLSMWTGDLYSSTASNEMIAAH